jgi:ferredoxin
MSATFLWNGQRVAFQPGETVARALARAGVIAFGIGHTGAPLSVFCGIGQCQNCLVFVVGEGPREACLMPCRDGLELVSLSGGDHG